MNNDNYKCGAYVYTGMPYIIISVAVYHMKMSSSVAVYHMIKQCGILSHENAKHAVWHPIT